MADDCIAVLVSCQHAYLAHYSNLAGMVELQLRKHVYPKP